MRLLCLKNLLRRTTKCARLSCWSFPIVRSRVGLTINIRRTLMPTKLLTPLRCPRLTLVRPKNTSTYIRLNGRGGLPKLLSGKLSTAKKPPNTSSYPLKNYRPRSMKLKKKRASKWPLQRRATLAIRPSFRIPRTLYLPRVVLKVRRMTLRPRDASRGRCRGP